MIRVSVLMKLVRRDWFGPLVVVTTALKPYEINELRKLGVGIVKIFKKQQLLKIAKNILKLDFIYESIILPPKTYNMRYSELSKENKSLNDLMASANANVIQKVLGQIEFNNAKLIIDKFDYKKTEYQLENIDKTNLVVIQKSGAESETSVAASSIIAKYLFEKEVDKLDKEYGLDLRKSNPEDIDSAIISDVAKIHFKNVQKYM